MLGVFTYHNNTSKTPASCSRAQGFRGLRGLGREALNMYVIVNRVGVGHDSHVLFSVVSGSPTSGLKDE